MSKNWWLAGLAALIVGSFILFYFSRDFSRSALQQKELQEYADAEFETWHEYTAPSSKFKVLLPVLPQHGQDTVNVPDAPGKREYDLYVSEKDDGTIFMISLIKILNDEKLDENTLTAVMNDILKASPNNKLKIMKMGKYKQYPAIDFSIENDQVNIDGKAFLVGNTLYLLTSVSKMMNYKKQEFEFFVNSFQLLNAERL
jgi:ATP-dependent helicase/DNAse subunit B